MIRFFAFVLFFATQELILCNNLPCDASDIAYEEITTQAGTQTNTFCDCQTETYKFSTGTSTDKQTTTVKYKCKKIRACVYAQKCGSLDVKPEENVLSTFCTCADGQVCHDTPEYADETRTFGDTKYHSFVCT
uniref:U-scoloptoxin(11)-Sa1a n=1 Tax=Scolopendra alternans TaxID=1329349 RepID=TXB1A_SCOAL|nr:RecName: Full=U-scoloptoxin(11)-Sa1a; Short=U-SLPTX(11)-Sa1a; Flags: Precursor [Scolopendra alternans]